MGVGKPESSVVSASTAGGNDPSLLSLRTDKSSYSVPDDGRAITIETNHQHRRQKSSNIDAQSALSQASQTSLLIEYFEGARGTGNSPAHRPSVRVKVTPSAQRKLNQQGTREIEIRGNEGRPGNRRNPSYTQRISLSPRVTGEERLLIAGSGKERSRRSGRTRSYSGEQHSAVSSRGVYEDEQSVSSFSELSSLVNPANAELMREGISPANESPRTRNRSGTIRAPRREREMTLQDGEESSVHPLNRRRSRSLSNEREVILGETGKLSRKRSKSMERERMTKEQREELREQRRLDKKLAAFGEKPATRSRSREFRKERHLKSPREDRRTRAMSRDRSKSRSRVDKTEKVEKALANREEIRNISGSSELSQNPVLLNAVEDAIKRLILPQLEALKGERQGHDNTMFDHATTAAIASEAARTFVKRASDPDLKKGSEGPLLVLQPDADKGTGYGLVLNGEKAQSVGHRSESVMSQAPGFGMGPDYEIHDGIEYYPVPKDHVVPQQAPPGERLRMPSIHDLSYFDLNPDVSREVVIENEDHKSHYLQDSELGLRSEVSALTDVQPATLPMPVAPLNISRNHTPSKGMASPRPSVANLRRKFDGSYQSDVGDDVEILSHQRSGRAGSNLSMNTISTMPDSRLTMNTGMQSNGGWRPGDISRTLEDEEPEDHMDQQHVSQSAHDREIHHEQNHEYYDRLEHENYHERAHQLDHNHEYDHEHDHQHQEGDRMGQWFDPENATYEQRSELETRDGYFEERSNNRDSVADSFEQRHLNRVAAGQDVKGVGALASMRSTPVAHSHRASVHDHLSSVSLRSQAQPQLGFSAVPISGEEFPEPGYYHSEVEQSELGHSEVGEEDDALTNPYGGERHSRDMTTGDDILTNPYGGERDSREINDDTWDYEKQFEKAQSAGNHDSFGRRAMQGGGLLNKDMLSHENLDAGIDRDMAITPMSKDKDEGYISGANPMSPGMETSKSIAREIEDFGGIDDVISEGPDEDFVPFRGGHHRGGSGNSHGMPSPLYDSSLGRGIDRIQSKDIVALMDHLTVRDAQRNARDTEILITLVRSAAEMRDSFEDLKRQIAAHHNQMVLEVDQSTDKTIARLAGPRVVPAPVNRQIKSTAFDHDKEETVKKANVFKRALKGLSSQKPNDLARIEDMLVTLLNEVEGLKTTGYAYSLSNGETSQAGDHSHMHIQHQQSQDSHQSQQGQSQQSQQSQASHLSQQILQHLSQSNLQQQHSQPNLQQMSQPSLHQLSQQNLQSHTSHQSHHSQDDRQSEDSYNGEQMQYGFSNPNLSRDQFNYDLNTVTEEPASIRESLHDGESAYFVNDNHHPSSINHDLGYDRERTPVQEDGMRTPRGIREAARGSTPVAVSPQVMTPPQPQQTFSNDNTPTKGKDKRESFPKVSRWSETTASSGIRSFFGRKKKQSGDPDVSRTNSEFEEDWVQPSDQMTDSPYTPAINRFSSPAREAEKPSLEANRRSLEIRHPIPRVKYNHQLEVAAESQPNLEPSSPTMTQSTTSLNRFIQNGGSYNNISALAPMVPEPNYSVPTMEFVPARNSPHVYDNMSLPPPTAISEAPTESVVSSPEKKKKKHRKHKKDDDRDDPERQARRERRRLQKQRKDQGLAPLPASSDDGRRPSSAGSDRSYTGGDDISVTRQQRQSHLTTGTFGL